MKNVNKSVLIWYSPEEMFALVTDVAHYADFLPWCDHAKVLEQDGTSMTAEVGIAFGGMRKAFVTRNIHSDMEGGGKQVSMRLVKGPFSRLEGNWRFHPVGDGSQRACKVELQLDYGFESGAVGAIIGPVFDRIAGSMVDAFIKRAEQIYG
ncbi:type II toxin-antitoxin system RatA family toxin [Comamonas testosteroni]|uniref:Type II toxin-antitoxin system RatA family toxin n=1 Tax=Comamonas testosteroni TaxID=285 RepID=A0A373FMV5_COMTE|nr:type II toxin-antitoxin system RatA family toxin [Comamonas testosteroni]RGE45247.1 type II toxin-antitoxin system RatA family toxin [Comamonas testosteroni]